MVINYFRNHDPGNEGEIDTCDFGPDNEGGGGEKAAKWLPNMVTAVGDHLVYPDVTHLNPVNLVANATGKNQS